MDFSSGNGDKKVLTANRLAEWLDKTDETMTYQLTERVALPNQRHRPNGRVATAREAITSFDKQFGKSAAFIL